MRSNLSSVKITLLISVISTQQFGRYTALIAGIMWGSHRYKVNKANEDAWRIEEAERKIVRDAKKAEEKQKLNREELIYLATQSGVKVPPNF